MCFEDFMSLQFGNKLIRQIHLKAHVQSMILQICKEKLKWEILEQENNQEH